MPTMEELRARYSRTETEADAVGRQITVSLLKPAQRYRVAEMSKSSLGYIIQAFLNAAAVRKIVGVDGKEMLFAPPLDRTDVDVVLDVLDDEGMLAVSRAIDRLSPTKADGTLKSEVEASGNSQGTPSSESTAFS